jgi:hypothetical protein
VVVPAEPGSRPRDAPRLTRRLAFVKPVRTSHVKVIMCGNEVIREQSSSLKAKHDSLEASKCSVASQEQFPVFD